ncbi:MAG: hypothetical protein LBD88_03315 [Candidatus Peribacteria bacterium]|nr:hypothetical protein [Candidatus Peribacteria bacterium]
MYDTPHVSLPSTKYQAPPLNRLGLSHSLYIKYLHTSLTIFHFSSSAFSCIKLYHSSFPSFIVCHSAYANSYGSPFGSLNKSGFSLRFSKFIVHWYQIFCLPLIHKSLFSCESCIKLSKFSHIDVLIDILVSNSFTSLILFASLASVAKP